MRVPYVLIVFLWHLHLAVAPVTPHDPDEKSAQLLNQSPASFPDFHLSSGPRTKAFPSLSLTPLHRIRGTETAYPLTLPGRHYTEPDFVAATGGPVYIPRGTRWDMVWRVFRHYHREMPRPMPLALDAGTREAETRRAAGHRKPERAASMDEEPCVRSKSSSAKRYGSTVGSRIISYRSESVSVHREALASHRQANALC